VPENFPLRALPVDYPSCFGRSLQLGFPFPVHYMSGQTQEYFPCLTFPSRSLRFPSTTILRHDFHDLQSPTIETYCTTATHYLAIVVTPLLSPSPSINYLRQNGSSTSANCKRVPGHISLSLQWLRVGSQRQVHVFHSTTRRIAFAERLLALHFFST
jgi:hypothetical protein